MSSTVSVGGFEVTSSHEGAAAMVESLKPSEADSDAPKILRDGGQDVEEPDPISKAASELGKKGGEAAAKARKEALKAKPIKDAPAKEGDEGKDRAAATEPANESETEPANEPTEAESTKKGNPRHDPQARVAEATRQAAEAKREAAELRARLDRIERERTAPPEQRPPAPQAQAPTEKPQAQDYESYEEYLDARDAWRDQESQRRQHAHQQASKRQQEVTGAIDGFKAALSRAGAADPEFGSKIAPEVWALEPSIAVPPGQPKTAQHWIADDFLSAPERAPALMLHLSEHPAELQRIAALSSPRAVTRELAKIEVTLEARTDAATAGTSPEREVSKANPPVTPVTGSPSVASGPRYREGMSLDEYASSWKPPKR